jgi:hypothetical protein
MQECGAVRFHRFFGFCLLAGCLGIGGARAGQPNARAAEPAVGVQPVCAAQPADEARSVCETQPARAEATPKPGLFGPRVPHKYWEADDVAERQSFDAFTSLQDGQPDAPGDWELEMSSGWSTLRHGPDATVAEPTLKYTPHRYTQSGYELWENSQLSLRMPVQVGDGEVEGNGDMTFGWQERWFKEGDIRLPSGGNGAAGGGGVALPSFSTLAEVRMPTGDRSNGADGTFTAILAKDFGPGTTYLNGWVSSVNGENVEDHRPFQWGARAGYKWRVLEPAKDEEGTSGGESAGQSGPSRLPKIDSVSIISAYNLQSSAERGHGDINTIDLAAEFRTKHHLVFGPGVSVGVDGHEETPRLAAGFRFVYEFNARNPPP